MSTPVTQVAPHDGTDDNAPIVVPETRAEASGPLNEDVNAHTFQSMTPLTKRQVFLLCFASLSDPVIVNFAYPFIVEV